MATQSTKTVLLADDDATIRFVVAKALKKSGFSVRSTDNPDTLVKWAKQGVGDVVLSDVHMGNQNVFDHLPNIQTSGIPIVIISANTGIVTAMKSREAKVFAYLPKPFDLNELSETLIRATQNSNPTDQTKITSSTTGHAIVGKSKAMQPVFRALAVLSDSQAHVFIHGQAGTGKTLCAQFLCAPPGEEAKNFLSYQTGMTANSLDELGDDGIILVERLDEETYANQLNIINIIDHISANPIQNIRVVATANRSLDELISKSDFRQDLASHFFAGQLELPPLSARTDDISELTTHFLTQLGAAGRGRKLSADALLVLKNHQWVGNVRELMQTLDKCVHFYPDRTISASMVRTILYAHSSETGSSVLASETADTLRNQVRALLLSDQHSPNNTAYSQALAWIEKPLIEEALKICGGNNSKAADLLGIHRNTLRAKIKTLDIDSH